VILDITDTDTADNFGVPDVSGVNLSVEPIILFESKTLSINIFGTLKADGGKC
jgi:hypothetical protein